jgi:hypothetical protein
MRVLLRHVRTGHYYRGNNEWSLERDDAVDFRGIERALEIITRDNLQGMSIVVRYDESGSEQVFDLSGGVPSQEPARETNQDEPEI